MDNIIFVTLVVILAIIFVLTLASTSTPQVEGLSGFGVTSALNFYNRANYSDEVCHYPGEAYSGGTYLVGKVVI